MGARIAMVAMLTTFLAVALGAVAGQAQEWSASGSAVLEARPGDFVTYGARVHNAAETAGSFTWSAQLPDGWSVLGSEGAIEVGPAQEETVFLTFYVPDLTPSGAYPFRFVIRSQSDGGLRELTAQVHVLPLRSVSVEQGDFPRGWAGELLEYNVLLTNRGNVSEELVYNVTSPGDWVVENPRGQVLVPAGERHPVIIRARSPRDTRSGTRRELELHVASTDGVISERLNLATLIAPPAPGHVSPLAPDMLRASLRFDTGAMGAGRHWRPSLSLLARGTVGEAQDTDLSLRLQVSQDEDGRVYPRRFDSEYRRDPWTVRLGFTSQSDWRLAERFTATYDQAPWWISAGDVSLRLSPLVQPTGRGGAARYFHPEGLDVGVLILGNTKGVTVGASAEHGRVRLSHLNGEREGGSVLSLYGEWDVSSEATLRGETALIDGDTAWFAGAEWKRAPWRVDGRYFWYAGDPVSGEDADRSGYELTIQGQAGSAPFSLYAGDIRTNVLRNPDEPVQHTRRIGLRSSFPVGQVLFRGTVRWDERLLLDRPGGDTERDRNRLNGNLTLQRYLDGTMYWIFRAEAASVNDRLEGESEAEFNVGPALGRSWSTLRAEVGLSLHGSGDSLGEAWDTASMGPRLMVDWRPDVRWNPRLRLEYLAGERSRFRASGSLELTPALDLVAQADARQRDDRIDWTYRIGLTHRFGLPVPGVYSRGNIEGVVYMASHDTAPVSGEGLAGIVLSAGGEAVSTDAEGRFRFPPLRPGEYEVRLESLNDVAVVYEPVVALPVLVEVEAGETAEVAIPIRLMARLAGRFVWATEQREGLIERSLAGIKLEVRRNGETVATVTTDALGFYQTPLVEPGRYEIAILEPTLPRFTELENGAVFDLYLEPGRITRQDIELLQREVPIRLDVKLEE